MNKQATKPWRWSAMEAQTRQGMALHGGERRRERANDLWTKRPVVDREPATVHTDHDAAPRGVIPAERHKAMNNKARQTNHSERFTHTLRQRGSRLVREPLSFSHKRAHHLGALKYLICSDNLARVAAAALSV